MNITGIVSELRTERTRIDKAIAALEELSANGNMTRNVPKRATVRAKKRGHLSPEGRRRLSELMKKRWAERRKKLSVKARAR